MAAVDGVSFDVAPGTICGLVGPNGAGKTTLINVVSGFDRGTSGEVLLDDRRITGWTPWNLARLGLVRTFQHAHAFATMTVREALVVAGQTPEGRFGSPRARWRRARSARILADEMLTRFDLGRWTGTLCAELPYGTRKRLGIGLALMRQPRVLLLDEPAAGLNSAETGALQSSLLDLRSTGITIVVVEHSMPLIRQVCDTVVVLDHGIKLADGSTADVLSDERVRGAYLGTR